MTKTFMRFLETQLAEAADKAEAMSSVDNRRSIMPCASTCQPTGVRFQTISAFAVYGVLSVLFFGRPIINHLAQSYIGGGTDPICHIWAIAWWPYAIAHRLNPLITHVLWAPVGYNLVWGTAIPGPSLLIYPITMIFGPVVSYNILCLLAPPIAGATAFMLCRYLCRQFWAALLGGYVFGFSPYILCHMLAHLVLILVFPLPLATYVTLLRLDAKIGRAGFVTGLIAILLFQFLSSTEILATATVFGGVALLLALILAGGESRSTLICLSKEIACAYVVVAVALAPYLYYVFVPGLPISPNPATAYSNDLLSFVVPPPVLFLGARISSSILGPFLKTAPWWEQAGYLGPGLWMIISLFAWSYWRTQVGKFLILNFVVVTIMSVGPMLHAGGKPLLIMPWRLFKDMPLINDALPGRFGIYLFLVAAVVTSIYLASASISPGWKALFSVLALVFIAPNLAIWLHIGPVPAFLSTPGHTRIYVPGFFDAGHYKRYLARGDNVLILPLDSDGSNAGMLWQAQSGFYFNSLDWFGAIAPPDSMRWPVMRAFQSGMKILDFSEQLDGFLGANQIKAIIVDSSAPGRWPALLSEAGMTADATGEVWFYKVPARVLVAYHGATAHQMAEKEAAASFAALVIAARRYMDQGFPLNKLALGEAQRLKLLALPEGQAPPAAALRWWRNLGLGNSGSLVCVGIVGNYQDLKFLINDYGPEAAGVFFPFPKRLLKQPKAIYGRLLLTFTPTGLQRAARKANVVGGPL